MQQHSQAVDGGVVTQAGCGQQRCFKRRVNHIAHVGVRGQGGQIQVQRLFALHPQTGGVDQQADVGQGAVAFRPGQGYDGRAKLLRQRQRGRQRAVDQANLLGTAIRQAQHHSACGTACTQHRDWPRVCAPIGFAVQQRLNETEAVVVKALERAVRLHHHRVDGSHKPRVGIDLMHQLQCIDLVR